jgi:outer membrane murein-binding lipoprotein Lpp
MRSVLSLVGLLLVLSGCTSKEDTWRAIVESDLMTLNASFKRLESHLEQGRIRNAKLMGVYAASMREQKPEMASLISILETEATPQGALYQGLLERYVDLGAKAPALILQGERGVNAIGSEIDALTAAVSSNSFGGALADPLNVLADMSEGTLPRVDAMSKAESLQANAAQDFGSASSMVGNPNYGQWQQQSNGTSFWAFYGQYRLMSDLLFGPVYYNSWARNRDYSYYGSRGYNNYTSPSQKAAESKRFSQTQKKFASQGKRFNSPYAKSTQQARGGRRTSAFSQVTKSPSKVSSSSSNRYSSRYKAGAFSNTSSRNNNSYNSRNTSSSRSYGGRGK